MLTNNSHKLFPSNRKVDRELIQTVWNIHMRLCMWKQNIFCDDCNVAQVCMILTITVFFLSQMKYS